MHNQPNRDNRKGAFVNIDPILYVIEEDLSYYKQ